MDVRGHVLRQLATPGRRIASAACTWRERFCPVPKVWEAVWGLVAEGLVYLDTESQGSGADNWRWKLSTAGVRVVEGGPWEPGDPAGYVRRLRHQVPDLDLLALRYVEEALRASSARCYVAASVMLGVASSRCSTCWPPPLCRRTVTRPPG